MKKKKKKLPSKDSKAALEVCWQKLMKKEARHHVKSCKVSVKIHKGQYSFERMGEGWVICRYSIMASSVCMHLLLLATNTENPV